MAYTANIPQPTDQINNSQPQLLANFQSIDTLVNVNHVNFDDPSGNQGKHKWSAYPGPSPSYTPPVVAGEVTLFNSLDTTTGVNELTIIKSNGNQVFATESILSPNTPPTQLGIGWTRFPSGILMVWNVTNSAVTTGKVINILPANEATFLTTPPPAFTVLSAVYLYPYYPSLTVGQTATTGSVNLVNIVNKNDWTQGFNCLVNGPSSSIFLQIVKIGW